MPHLPFEAGFEARAVSPFREMGAYEALWSDPHTTFRSLSKRFAEHPGSVPSDFVPPGDAEECATFVQQRFTAAQISHFGVRVHGAGEYPEKLRDATSRASLTRCCGNSREKPATACLQLRERSTNRNRRLCCTNHKIWSSSSRPVTPGSRSRCTKTGEILYSASFAATSSGSEANSSGPDCAGAMVSTISRPWYAAREFAP